jgi:hypothetical protein
VEIPVTVLLAAALLLLLLQPHMASIMLIAKTSFKYDITNLR